MKYQDVYNLSLQYSPPQVNLRDAQILDDYGDETYATMPIVHHSPNDVKRTELEFYVWIYPFVAGTDLLFYLYPIALEYEKDKHLECVSSFLYTLDRRVETLLAEINQAQQDALINGLKWIYESGGTDYADWWQCPNLQRLIGIRTGE